MARIPDAELERLKAEVSVERLVEASGIALTRSGKDRIGKCPFHEGRHGLPGGLAHAQLVSLLRVRRGGGPIDWVMRTQGVSFRHAVERLKADLSMAPIPADGLVKQSGARVIPPPVAFDADDQEILQQTIAYYQETLKQAPEALAYLKARGLDHPGGHRPLQAGLRQPDPGLQPAGEGGEGRRRDPGAPGEAGPLP